MWLKWLIPFWKISNMLNFYKKYYLQLKKRYGNIGEKILISYQNRALTSMAKILSYIYAFDVYKVKEFWSPRS